MDLNEMWKIIQNTFLKNVFDSDRGFKGATKFYFMFYQHRRITRIFLVQGGFLGIRALQ